MSWETSNTGGAMIGVQEAARILQISDTQLKRIMSKIGLKPATPFNPLVQRQTIKFYLADVERIKDEAAAKNIQEKKAFSAVA
jgi:hypothetical protein